MVKARLAFLTSQLGRTGAARNLLKKLREIPRSHIAFAEAWNDYFLGLTRENCSQDGRQMLSRARECFQELSAPFGWERCTAALLQAGIQHQDEQGLRQLLRQLEALPPGDHARLAVETPLTCAEACLFLGEVERARQHLFQASGAILGKLFPELDLRLEAAWSKVAAISGDSGRAQQHLHRALVLRTHLSEKLGKKDRERFLTQKRWESLSQLEEGLFPPPREPARRRHDTGFGLVARSPAMGEVLRQVRQVGPKDLSVLIRGPTGCGKDLTAQAIHEASTRRTGPFLVVHVPSLRGELFEAELFGYTRGAFTGAEKDHPGLLQGANGGTVLFDEIAGLELPLQAKLLRVLDAREVRPLGGTQAFPLDVRFLFITARDLRLLARQGSFREDLYWRMAQAEITVPPLRERKEDMPELAALLLRKHSRLGRPAPALLPDLISFLCEQPWPGNVRQLETVLLRALLSCGSEGALSKEHILAVLSSPHPVGLIPDELLDSDDIDSLRREIEILWLRKRFLAAGGSVSEMARKIGLKRASLYAWFKRLGVNPDLWREEMAR